MESSTPQQQDKTPDRDEKEPLLIQYARWTMEYMYQFAGNNPFLAVVIALLIVVLFALVVPVITSKLFSLQNM